MGTHFARILKFNPAHDAKGLFAVKPGGTMAAKERPGLQKLRDQLSKPEGGFTVHPTTGDQPTTGFSVSIKDGPMIPIKDLTPVDLIHHVRANQDLLSQEGNFIGAWHNPEDGKVYLDISRVVETQEEAERIGNELDQIAIFDFERGKPIYLKKVA